MISRDDLYLAVEHGAAKVGNCHLRRGNRTTAAVVGVNEPGNRAGVGSQSNFHLEMNIGDQVVRRDLQPFRQVRRLQPVDSRTCSLTVVEKQSEFSAEHRQGPGWITSSFLRIRRAL